MQIYISDASILIDIENSELTLAMFSLPYQFAIPDILFSEELSERHYHLLELGLISKAMDGGLIAKAYNLRQKYCKPSMNDLLALTLAEHESCPLLTGDKALRDVAKALDVKVHGIIWLVGRMIHHKKINVDTARIAFQCMKDSGGRLPWNEVEIMIRQNMHSISAKVPTYLLTTEVLKVDGIC